MARKTTKAPTTTRSTTTTKKPTSRAKTAAKKPKAVRATPAKAAPVKATKPATVAPEVLPTPDVIKTLSKRELIDRVVEVSGVKKKDAKPVIEATLRELGQALAQGDTLNLQPFGKGIVKSRKTLENADVVELRLRRSHQSAANSGTSSDTRDAPPLAEAAE